MQGPSRGKALRDLNVLLTRHKSVSVGKQLHAYTAFLALCWSAAEGALLK